MGILWSPYGYTGRPLGVHQPDLSGCSEGRRHGRPSSLIMFCPTRHHEEKFIGSPPSMETESASYPIQYTLLGKIINGLEISWRVVGVWKEGAWLV